MPRGCSDLWLGPWEVDSAPGCAPSSPVACPSLSSVLASALLGLTLAAAPPRWTDLDEPGRASAMAELRALPLPGRLLRASERFLGTPYGTSPLGEGEGVDPDPRLRWDRVDCVTMVEESMAVALAGGPSRLLDVLDHIRYRNGLATYATRNHLMEAGWLQANAEAGFVRDITQEVGGPEAVQGVKLLVDEAWDSELGRSLGLPAAARLTGAFAFGLLPVDRVLPHAGSIPDGALLLVVREDGADRVTRVSHLGLVVQREGHTYLRHATTRSPAQVVDEELGHFFAYHRTLPWKVVGVSLWEVRDPRVP
jgi:Protein of unknown function (DUF1460)